MWITFVYICLILCILFYPELSFQYASAGLLLWFERMVPRLLPFMILSSTVIRLGYSEKIGMILHPVLSFLYRCSKNVSFGLTMGLLCGFPMGARVAAQLYETNQITKKEAEFLLYISNSIGPVYFCGFAIPLLGLNNIPLLLVGMYGIPLLYGFVLRCTIYRNMPSIPSDSNGTLLQQCRIETLLDELNNAIHLSVEGILSMGGYMVLFNLLYIVPSLIFKNKAILLYPFLEITGGLVALGTAAPMISLWMLSFGGLCCICQTYNCIAKTNLSIGKYVVHKAILGICSLLYYMCIFAL